MIKLESIVAYVGVLYLLTEIAKNLLALPF